MHQTHFKAHPTVAATEGPPVPRLIVQKYGGSSLARPEQIRAVAERIAELRHSGHALLIVVSAMGKTTDQLIELAYLVSTAPNRRELDMLLTTGERVSMTLLSMALNERGCPAISFTGSQAGVFTDELHSNARIVDVKPIRIESELLRRNTVVLAGFQGVSPRTKEITTLGRGGSDTTAVAMAAHFKAERCEIRKDVDGVYTADPHLVGGARHIATIHYSSMLDMTFWGAKVLHYRSVELAYLLKIPLLIGLAHGDGRSTLINGDANMYEQARILSVSTHREVRWLKIDEPEMAGALTAFSTALKERDLPIPQLLDTEKREDGWAFLITAPTESLKAIERLLAQERAISFDPAELSTVTATCQGSFASPLPEELALALARRNIPVKKLLFGAMSLTAVIEAKDRDKAVQIIHDLLPSATAVESN